MRLVFAGTGAFAVPALRTLVEAGHAVTLVVTQPDRPAGRGLRLRPSPVKLAALDLGLPVFQPERVREEDAVQRLRDERPTAVVVAAYGQILPASLLELAPLKSINVHASLLPRHRGPAPIAWAILLGDRETGVTIMQMDEGVDTGPTYAQERVPIGPRETVSSLEARLAASGAGLLRRTLPEIESGRLRPVPQPGAGATRARRLTAEDGRLTPAMPADEIDRRVRALTPSPGCWIRLPQGEVKVLAGHPAADGTSRSDPLIETPAGAYVIEELQVPGGRPMSAAAWLRGRR